MNTERPNADKLLEVLKKEDANSTRGQLRVFLGMSPGVGKTYSMLKAAKFQQNRLVNVKVGVVETHGRKETEELLDGLSIIPLKKIGYKDKVLQELNLERILELKPDIVLVDELAHTNAPGSKYLKRYQDVEEILAYGINVYTTLNIQHIESRNDQIAQITGIVVKETVPDSFLEKASQIEVIDLSPPELLQRLKEGKVYMGDMAVMAANNFFKEEHLIALRELALRFTAEAVDNHLQDQMLIKGIAGPWNVNERILVAISHSPYTPRLIRAARNIAQGLNAPWIALYVDLGIDLNSEDQIMLKNNLALAKNMGAELISITEMDIVKAIEKVCREKNVTQVIIGRPDRRFFQDIIKGGTLLDQLVKRLNKIDVHVLRSERKPKFLGIDLSFPKFSSGFIEYYSAAWLLFWVSIICYLLSPFIGYQALGSLFLLAIMIISLVSNRGAILFSAIVSAFVWNFFFIPPKFTFSIHSYEDLMMLMSFFVAAIASGFLTNRIRKQEKILYKRESRMSTLYELVKSLSKTNNIGEITELLVAAIDQQFRLKNSVLLLDSKTGLLSKTKTPLEINEKDFAVASWVLESGKPAGWTTETLSESRCLCLPIKGNQQTIGVLFIFKNKTLKSFNLDQEIFIQTVISQVAIAIERLQFIESSQNAKVYEASEKLYQTLINSVSHELRTPITTIIGSASVLKDFTGGVDDNIRDGIALELISSAKRLNRVVENLLDVSRIEKGSIQIKQEWFEAQELINSVLNTLQDEIGSRKVIINCQDSILVEGDFKLLENALINLVVNALNYSPAQTEIIIGIEKHLDLVSFEIKDCGNGIPLGQEENIFGKFFRLPNSPAGGLGLGLSIVKNIVELHKGHIVAKNREDKKGAIFQLSIPVRHTPQKLKDIFI